MHNKRRTLIKGLASFGIIGAFGDTRSLASNMAGIREQADNGKENDLVFVFQGDSITDGERSRNNDLNNNTGHGYVYCVAARVGADMPERKFTFINRGNSGSDILGMADRWKTDTLDNNPDVLSILIGINDCNAYLRDKNEKHSIANYEAIYRSLLDQARVKNPDITFVLCQPFTLPYTDIEADKRPMQKDVEQRAAVVKKLATEYNAIFVPFQDVFNNALKRASEKYWIWDNVHPTVAGHELLTREWLKQVSKRLKFLKKDVW